MCVCVCVCMWYKAVYAEWHVVYVRVYVFVTCIGLCYLLWRLMLCWCAVCVLCIHVFTCVFVCIHDIGMQCTTTCIHKILKCTFLCLCTWCWCVCVCVVWTVKALGILFVLTCLYEICWYGWCVYMCVCTCVCACARVHICMYSIVCH